MKRLLIDLLAMVFGSVIVIGAAVGTSSAGSNNLTWMSMLLGGSTGAPASCDVSHLDLCSSEPDCTGAGGYWWSDNSCHADLEEVASCDSSHFNLCTSEPDCTGAGGYWWSDNNCQNSPEHLPGTVESAGQWWMDRNLGAARVATSYNDDQAYGFLFQWGRLDDGHQSRVSSNTYTLSATDTPVDGRFILGEPTKANDWRWPQNNDLWQGASGTNNPCPAGFRLPTQPELETEWASWNYNHRVGAMNSPLKLPAAGIRYTTGSIHDAGNEGHYWSSTVDGTNSFALKFTGVSADKSYSTARGIGMSVRCIED